MGLRAEHAEWPTLAGNAPGPRRGLRVAVSPIRQRSRCVVHRRRGWRLAPHQAPIDDHFTTAGHGHIDLEARDRLPGRFVADSNRIQL